MPRLRWPLLRPESAQLAGWGMLAAVGLATAHLASSPTPLRPATAAARDVYIVAQLLAAGVLAYAAVALWRRFGPKSPVAAYLAVAAATLAVTWTSLNEDLAVLAGKMPLPYAVAHGLLIAVVAGSVPVAALLGRLLARPWLRALGVLGAIGLAVADNLVLPDDYAGMHLAAALAAATLFGVAAATPDAPAGGRVNRIVPAVLAVVGVLSVLITPRSSVALAIYRVPGEVVAPWLARLRDRFGGEGLGGAGDLAALDAAHAEWWKSRLGHPPIPASTPPLLPQKPIVILITIDCMRANLLTDKVRGIPLPAMDELSRESVQFTRARSTAPSTAQSISSIFSGRYYSELYWRPRPNESVESVYPYEDPAPRFTDLLAGAGVDTVTFSGMPGLVNAYGTVHGFKEETILRAKGFADAHAIMTPALERLAKQGDRPMFLYLHFTDAHAPYDHAGTKGTQYERYLRGLALVDTELGALFAALGENPALRERTSVLLSADHGEAFGEHHQFFHATSLYEEALRVPLLVHVPGVTPRQVDGPVSLIDLAPTLLDLFGLPTPGELMGQSLVPYLRGEDPVLTRPIVADSSRLMRSIVFPDGLKVIHDRRRGTVELYDVVKDPRELHEILDERGAEGDARLRALQSFFRVHTLKRPGYVVPYGR